MTRIRRLLAFPLLLAALIGPAAAPSRAQNVNPNEADLIPPAPEDTSSGGDPWYGYAAAIAIGGLAIFIVCKSARR